MEKLKIFIDKDRCVPRDNGWEKDRTCLLILNVCYVNIELRNTQYT